MTDTLPKILLTGGSGLIGSRLQQLLSPYFNFQDASLESGINLLDSTQLDSFLNQNHDAQALIHLAAFTDVKKAQEQTGNTKDTCYQLNVKVTDQIAKLCAKQKIHLIYLSTAYVFDGTKPANRKYTESDTPNPIGWYAQTKFAGEQAITKHQPPHTILRIDFPYGPKFSNKTDWVWTIINRLQQNQLYPMFTDQWQTPIFIDDIAQSIHKILCTKANNHVLHLAPSSVTTPYESAKLIATYLHLSPELVKMGKFSDYQKSQPDSAKLLRRNVTLSNRQAQQLYNIVFTDLPTALNQILHP